MIVSDTGTELTSNSILGWQIGRGSDYRLSKVSGLFLISRHSAFAYKERAVDIRLVARELDVRYVVEGSVRRAANRVRINAQLIEATALTASDRLLQKDLG